MIMPGTVAVVGIGALLCSVGVACGGHSEREGNSAGASSDQAGSVSGGNGDAPASGSGGTDQGGEDRAGASAAGAHDTAHGGASSAGTGSDGNGMGAEGNHPPTSPCFARGGGVGGGTSAVGARGNCGANPPADLTLMNGTTSDTDPPRGSGPVILWCNSPTDIWGTDVPSSGYAGSLPTRLMHWDGATWTAITPEGYDKYHLSGWGSGPNDVWIVGHAGHVSWAHAAFALHWDGAEWRKLKGFDAQDWQEHVVARVDGNALLINDFVVPRPVPAACLEPLGDDSP